ncbi:glutamine synthetase family protein [Streptomyces sp. V4-01]|uniref:Glutamine synthetase family protein n=1 Tax=Actinacidiphila polyblastidii TaxID=3110430 RepID=A0ABU7PDU6_9ACTN|nr:glutamine synthetase family protein [Streptomyces sp. V4-01]
MTHDDSPEVHPELRAYADRHRGRADHELKTFDELHQLVAGGQLATVLLGLPDMQGRLVGKRFDARYFLEHVAAEGTEVCSYLLATDLDMRPLDGYGLASWQTGYGDIYLQPDLTAWWPADRAHRSEEPQKIREVIVLADARHLKAGPVEVSPRQVLRRQLRRLEADFGLTVKAGLETEFTLFQGAQDVALRSLRPLGSHNSDYALHHPLALGQFLRELEDTLAGAGMPLEAVKTEADPGQVEVTFRYGPALAAADQHVIFKHLTRQAAQWTQNAATFMAAPTTGTSNGLHLHLSLWCGQESALIDDGRDALSRTAQHALGGLVDVLPQLMPLMLPYTNSYKRLAPGSFAPSRMCWGHDNRAAAVRVVGHGQSLHLEIRIPGADANPYLALAAALAAIRSGLERSLPLPEGVTGVDFGQAPRLPRDLPHALSVFAGSDRAGQLLTPDVVAHYTRAARHEADVLAATVTDAERIRGFARA